MNSVRAVLAVAIAGELGQRDIHAHPADCKGVAGPEIGFQIRGQAPALVEYNRVGLAEIVQVESLAVKRNRGMATRHVGIAQYDIAPWMAADCNRLHAVDIFVALLALCLPL